MAASPDITAFQIGGQIDLIDLYGFAAVVRGGNFKWRQKAGGKNRYFFVVLAHANGLDARASYVNADNISRAALKILYNFFDRLHILQWLTFVQY